ncbi:hypothetical protein GCM10011428_57450 [Streptomyces violaceus]
MPFRPERSLCCSAWTASWTRCASSRTCSATASPCSRSRWEGALDTDRAKKTLDGDYAAPPEDDDEGDGEKGVGAEASAAEPTAAEVPASGIPTQKPKEPAPEVG